MEESVDLVTVLPRSGHVAVTFLITDKQLFELWDHLQTIAARQGEARNPGQRPSQPLDGSLAEVNWKRDAAPPLSWRKLQPPAASC